MFLIYPKNYYSFSESSHENRLVKFVRDWIESGKVARYRKLLNGPIHSIIDIGCGDGRLLDILKMNLPPNIRFAGIEIDHGAVHIAQKKGYEILDGDFEQHDMSSCQNSFNLVLMHQVLEHTRDPRKVIQKIFNILKVGGVLSIETPDTYSWDFKIFKNKYWGGYHIPRHFYLFNKKNLCQLLVSVGFEVISCRSILSPVFWIHSIHNYLIDSKRGQRLAKFFHYQNPVLLFFATLFDCIQIFLFRKSSNMQILVRKI
jgi:2-polyprenyl-3-methyl-5-hydroxy-6-metoxy-1,4-benzoquinol methylase